MYLARYSSKMYYWCIKQQQKNHYCKPEKLIGTTYIGTSAKNALN